MVMRGLLVGLLVAAAAADVAAQEVRLFGESGSELHLTPANADSSLNPGNVLNIAGRSNSSDVTLFGDISKDQRWKLQLKLRASHEWSRDVESAVDVDELSFKYEVTPWLDLRAGRKIERWGTGYAWNPTGVVNPPKDPSDPNDRRSTFRGVDMVAADLFVKGWDLTLLGAPQLSRRRNDGRWLRSMAWAGRAYRVMKGTDIALTASGGDGLPDSQGLSLARVFGDALELHAEVAHIRDQQRLVPGMAPAFVRRPHTQVLVGGQYTFRNNVNVTAELFHTGNGLRSAEWRQFREFAASAHTRLNEGDPSLLAAANAQFTPLGMAKNYTFARVLVPIVANRLEAETVVLTSLRDGSSLVRPGLSWRVHRNVSVYWLQSEFLGAARTEIGHVQIRRRSDIGIRYHFSIRDTTTRAPESRR
jgi:hypothetical protein